MRVILFFDLPVVKKSERRAYTRFRKYLIQEGYIMLQFSVYCKILNNRESAEKHIQAIKKEVPNNGNVRVLMVTEKQYASMEFIVGGRSRQETVVTIEPLLEL